MEVFWLFLATCAAWLGLEFWYAFTGQPVITTRVREAYRANPWIGWMIVGVAALLAGHLFWGGS